MDPTLVLTSSCRRALSIAYSTAFEWANSQDFPMFSLSADSVSTLSGEQYVDGTLVVPGYPFTGYSMVREAQRDPRFFSPYRLVIVYDPELL